MLTVIGMLLCLLTSFMTEQPIYRYGIPRDSKPPYTMIKEP